MHRSGQMSRAATGGRGVSGPGGVFINEEAHLNILHVVNMCACVGCGMVRYGAGSAFSRGV